MKICIVGPSGAGKTTITKKLADELKISTYIFDEIYWNISGTEFVKNSEETISRGTQEIVLQDRWIVEGAYDKRLLPLLLECSLILKMEVPFYLRTIRLLQRYLQSVVTGKKPKETLKNTIELIWFSHNFDKRLEKFLSSNAQLSKKTIPFNNFSKAINIIQTFFKNN
ncbi:AAA domain-containing protein [Acinetobacter pittii]|uniref:AAA family ATPase n=1 Tax=Acinetobacter TaxID=469 RepID=UPI00044FE1D9|nr:MULTISPECIES: AAA family ATPase [Acinetobacter]EXE80463.1 ATPase associated with various cellular activities family protein [Acinetobacter sp. 1578804]KCX15936.1 ATPase associated with various cellular activities family protein [Acinetobacter sp. 1264765]KQE22892.1 AAA family ATPase [Acinetobacter pittii]KRJ47880.1 AAA family ATPase [Acinetobacter pittii]MBJ8488483.1 AAA family ATPase [Acinetobacter pittii]